MTDATYCYNKLYSIQLLLYSFTFYILFHLILFYMYIVYLFLHLSCPIGSYTTLLYYFLLFLFVCLVVLGITIFVDTTIVMHKTIKPLNESLKHDNDKSPNITPASCASSQNTNMEDCSLHSGR